MHVFFEPNIVGETIILNEEESKHCSRVLRLKKGDEVFIANGKGNKITAQIIDDNVKKCILLIVNNQLVQPNQNYKLHILIAPTKNADKTDWFIEKATELGINQITFIETQNSERTKINLDRSLKIAISAMKQSKQWYLPKINNIVKFKEAINHITQNQLNLIAWCNANQTDTINFRLSAYLSQQFIHQTMQQHNHSVNIFIGPEGDFTQAEIELATTQNCKPISFGNTILRTETAAIYAVAAVKTLLS